MKKLLLLVFVAMLAGCGDTNYVEPKYEVTASVLSVVTPESIVGCGNTITNIYLTKPSNFTHLMITFTGTEMQVLCTLLNPKSGFDSYEMRTFYPQ